MLFAFDDHDVMLWDVLDHDDIMVWYDMVLYDSHRKLEKPKAATRKDQKDNEKRRRNTSGIRKG